MVSAADTPLIPPTRPGGLPERPPIWPTALGVTGIIWSVLNLLCGASAYLTPQIYEGLQSLAAAGGQPDASMEIQTQVVKEYFWLMILSTTAWEAAFLWLLIASIGMLRRRPWAPRSCIACSIVAIVATLFDLLTQFILFKQTALRLSEAGLDAEVRATAGGGVFSVCMTLVLGLAMPVFMLIWFKRPKVKDEVATWRTR